MGVILLQILFGDFLSLGHESPYKSEMGTKYKWTQFPETSFVTAVVEYRARKLKQKIMKFSNKFHKRSYVLVLFILFIYQLLKWNINRFLMENSTDNSHSLHVLTNYFEPYMYQSQNGFFFQRNRIRIHKNNC